MKRFLYTALALIGLAALGTLCGYWVTNGSRQLEAQAAATGGQEDYVMVGGVRRPATDVQPVDTEDPPTAKRPDVGRIEPVPDDANVHVRSVAEARREQRYPERLSALHQPAAFDLEQYLLDAEAYLNIVEPGRVFQPAQPGPDVPVLHPLSPRRTKIDQGQSVTLSVKTLPDMPATFTIFHPGGAFENRLSSITVAADAEGVAQTSFTGIRGTFGDVRILAASPVATEQATFVVHVVPPQVAD